MKFHSLPLKSRQGSWKFDDEVKSNFNLFLVKKYFLEIIKDMDDRLRLAAAPLHSSQTFNSIWQNLRNLIKTEKLSAHNKLPK